MLNGITSLVSFRIPKCTTQSSAQTYKQGGRNADAVEFAVFLEIKRLLYKMGKYNKHTLTCVLPWGLCFVFVAQGLNANFFAIFQPARAVVNFDTWIKSAHPGASLQRHASTDKEEKADEGGPMSLSERSHGCGFFGKEGYKTSTPANRSGTAQSGQAFQ